jgi:hypothetical protein
MTEDPVGIMPSMYEVERRAICLYLFLGRWELEEKFKQDDSPKSRNELRKEAELLAIIMKASSYAHQFSAHEVKLVAKSFGSWINVDLNHGQAWSDSLGTLLWLIQDLHDVPLCNDPFDHNNFLTHVPDLNHPSRFFGRHQFRGIEEIDSQWQLSSTYMIRNLISFPDEVKVMDQLKRLFPLERITRHMVATGLVKALIKEDLPVGDKAFCDLSQDELTKCFWLLHGRNIALIWILGKSEGWDPYNYDSDILNRIKLL